MRSCRLISDYLSSLDPEMSLHKISEAVFSFNPHMLQSLYSVAFAMNEQVSEVGSLVWARMKGINFNIIFICSLVSQVSLPGLPGSLGPS